MGNQVNHPDYYQLGNGLEVVEVIKAKTAGMDGFMGYCTGKMLEHALRWDKRNGKKDLEEVSWWSQYMIDQINENVKKQVDTYTAKVQEGTMNYGQLQQQ